MAKIVLYIAVSLDGFIARADGGLDWLYALPNTDKTDHGYAQFLSTIGTTVMGRNTYSEIMSFGVEWPYMEQDSFIVTKNKNLHINSPRTHLITEDVKGFFENMKGKEKKDIWLIGGGEIITYFLNNDLVDKIILSVVPVILGNGKPLFPNNPKESKWDLLESMTFETGIVNLVYAKKE